MADQTYSAEDMKAAYLAAGGDPSKIDAMTESLQKRSRAVKEATQDTSDFNERQTLSEEAMKGLNTIVENTLGKLESLGNLIGADANDFALLSTGIIGASKELTNFGVGFTGRLGSVSNDMGTLIDNVKGVAKESLVGNIAAGTLVKTLSAMGIGGAKVTELLGGTVGGLKNFANAFVNSVDNGLKMESMLLQSTAAGGAYNEFIEEAGENLENLNKVTARFQSTMGGALFTGESIDNIAKYTQSIMALPGGYKAMTDGMDITGQHTSSLVGVIQMAQGAGLDINQTFLDINKTLAESGSSYEDSTRLIGRFADVAHDLGAQMPEIRDALFGITGAFKMFSTGGDQATKMNQGLTDSLKSYAWQLQQTGLPIESAIELAKKQVIGMKDLGIAQNALISQTTGGKGGLQGAFEYDLLKRTNPELAFKKMQESFKQAAGGTILTEEQAVKSGNTEQYAKQAMLLKSGNFGMKAGSDEEVYALTNQLAAGKMAPPTMTDEEKKIRLAKETSMGETQQKLSFNAVREVNISTERIRIGDQTLNLGMFQHAGTAAGGGTSQDSNRGANIEGRERLNAFIDNSAHPKGDNPMGDNLKGFSQALRDAASGVTTGAQSIGEQLTNSPKPTKAEEQKSIADKIRARSQVAGMTGGGSFAGFGQPYNPAGRQVGQAIPHDNKSHITSGREPAMAAAGGANGQPVQVTLVGGSGITVNFTGKCPHCNWDINSNEHATVNSPASQKPR